MSILDGQVTLNGETRNNNNSNRGNRGNRNNRNDNNFKNKNRNRRFDGGETGFSRSSYLADDELSGNTQEEVRTDDRADTIIDFCEEFANNVDNYRTLQDIMIDKFPETIVFIKQYYSQKNTPAFQDALNKLIKTMCTSQFADTLMSVLISGEWEEGGVYDKIWDAIGFGISITLETNHERMHTDVIKQYAIKIIPRMYKTEINDICVQTGVTKDLANDLIIAIPVSLNDWNAANMDAFYTRFLEKMIVHAEDNADILNWEVQGKLYEIFFGKSKTALKMIGKYFTSAPMPESDSEVVNAVYEEFKKMLYKKLDQYDIADIEYVITFVAKKKEENPDNEIIFKPVTASEYENVRKGLLSVMDKNAEYMKVLA